MMTFLICLVAVALIVATMLFKKDAQTLNKVAGALGVLLLLLLVLRFTTCSNKTPPPAHVTVDRNYVVGWRLGSLVAEAVPEGSKIIVLQSKPSTEAMTAVAESQLAGLRETLPEKAFDVVVHSPSFLRTVEPGAPDADADAGATDEDILDEVKDAQALVSFAYFPVSTRKKSRFPPIYLLDAQGGGYWVAAMKAGIVQAAITTHRDSSKINLNLKKGSPQERFDAIYEVFTPENVDTFK